MKIYVIGSSKNKFLPLDNIREKFLIDQPHEGDNIDNLNPWYCELTGLYYLWKHVDDEVVGLEHYRRYFVNNKNKLLSEQEINKLLKTTDIICIKSTGYSRSVPVYSWANRNNKRLEFEKFMLFVKHYVGQEYYDCCKKVFNSDHHIMCNMIICKKELLNEYCEFIFDVLNVYQQAEAEANRTIPKRMLGYFTEFFFEAWCKYTGKTYKFNKLRFIR